LRLFVVIGGLIVAVLFAALLAPLFVNWSDYKGRFEAEASRLLGQPVRVAGEASARILPFPSVSFSDVEVGPPEAPMITAAQFSFDAELAPFLSGEVLIFDLRITDPVMNVTLDETGAPIWPLPDTGPIDPAQITLENAAVTNGRLVVLDPFDERRWTVSDIDMAVSANSFFGPWRAEGTARIDTLNTQFTIGTGTLERDGFSLRVAANLPDQIVRIVTEGRIAPDVDSGEMVYTGGLTLLPHGIDQTYRVDGDFAATARRLDVGEYRAAFGDPADPYVITGTASVFGGAEPGYTLTARGTQVNMPTGSDAEAGDAAGLGERMAAINAMLAGLPLPAVPGTINLDLPAIVAGETTIRDVQVLARPEPRDADRRRWRIDRLDAQFPGRTALEADGVLTLPRPGETMEAASFDGNLVVASRQPSGLARWLAGDVDEAIRQLPGAGLSAQVTLGAERQLAENVEIIVGGTQLAGRIARRGGALSTPYLSVALAGEMIDRPTLDAMASVFGAGEGGAGLSGHDVDLSLDLRDVDAGGIVLDHVDTAIRTRGARTEIDRLVASGVFGASVTAAGSVERLGGGDLAVTFDASVIGASGAPFFTGVAERFEGHGLIDHLADVARRDPAAVADMQLTLVGSARTADGAARTEASASLSGTLGGANVFAQSNLTDMGATEEIDRLAVDGSVAHDDALRLLPLAGIVPAVANGVTVGLDAPGQVAVTLRRAEGGDDTVSVTATSGADRLDFEGTRDGADFAGDANLALADAEPWLSALGHVLPGTGLGTPLDLAATIQRNGAVWRFDEMGGTVAGTDMGGALTFTDDALLGWSLRGQLDLDAFDGMLLAGLVTGHVDAIGPDTGFGAPIYDGAAVNLDWTAERLFAGPVAFEQADGTLVMNGGLATMQNMTALLGEDSQIAATMRVQNAGGAVSLGGEVELVAVALGDLAAVPVPVTGAADLALSLTGGGRTLSELGRSLTGTGVVAADDLAVDGLDADGFDAIIDGADAIGFGITPAQIQTVVEDALFSGQTWLGAAEAPLTVTGGIARAANLSFGDQDGRLQITGDVTLDLIERAPTGALTVTLDPGSEAIAGMAPAVDLSFGPDEAETLGAAIGYQPVTAYLTQRALEIEQARIERLQARLLERQRMRRELRYARYLRAEDNARREESRLRAIADERRAALEAQRAAEAEAAAIEQINAPAPAPAPLLAEPPETPAPEAAPEEAAVPTDAAVQVPETIAGDDVVRAPLPPVSGEPTAAPAPGIDFSEDAVRSLIEGLGQ
jgi:hypothetical protein